jgi:hypothetical protein
MAEVDQEARQWMRHHLEAPLFFNVTKEQTPLEHDQHMLEAKLLDVSESGFRFQSSFGLSVQDEISFDVSSKDKVVFSGVALVVHQDNDIHGAKFVKIYKH